jgi:hypothetical protein
MTSYSDVSLMIDGTWTKGANGRNPIRPRKK